MSEDSALEELRYPVGRFRLEAAVDPEKRRSLMAQIRSCPGHLRAALQGLDDAQLDTRYRPDGWTIRQVTHHVVDSHMNGYARCRWALTEENPVFKGYDQALWADLTDARTLDVEPSLRLLEALHARWIELFEALTDEQWVRSGRSPDGYALSVEGLLQLYTWHGRHHTAHITGLRSRMGW